MADNDQIVQLLGEIRGELKGINAVMERNHQSMNQRLDDIQSSNNQRFDAVERRVDHMESEQKAIIWKVASWSSLGGAIVAGGVELIKHMGK